MRWPCSLSAIIVLASYLIPFGYTAPNPSKKPSKKVLAHEQKLDISPQSPYCSFLVQALNDLKINATVSAYCSQALSIRTSTTTITVSTTAVTKKVVTITAAPITKNITTTITAFTNVPSEIVTNVITVTNTLPPANIITTVMCLPGASTSNEHLPALRERAQLTLPDQLRDYVPPNRSPTEACPCLNIHKPAMQTYTSTITLSTRTVTVTTEITPVTTLTMNEYTTATISSGTITTTITQTETTQARTTSIALARNGLSVRAYNHEISDLNYVPLFPSNQLKTQTPYSNFALPEPNFRFNDENISYIMQGYFIANETGNHTFSTDSNAVDNWNVLWLGEAAYNWTEGTQAYAASRTRDESSYKGGSAMVFLTPGSVLPMTFLWANGKGPGNSQLLVENPSGTLLTNLTGYFIQPCPNGAFS